MTINSQILISRHFPLLFSHLQLLAGKVSPLSTLTLLLAVFVQLVLAVYHLRTL